MKIIREFSRVILGITFIFSGFVKGIDPLGSTYKFIDYFTAFGTDWANKLAFFLSILLSAVEFGIGVGLLFNYRMKIFSWLVVLFMGFFLPFTLWIAIANPVHDCGCFGDAWVLSNWQTFYKNIVLGVLAIVVFWQRQNFINNYNIHFQNTYFIFFMLVFGFAQHWSYNHLPIFDFRPYKIGSNISEGMIIPDNVELDQYKTQFIYRNKQSGKEKKFNEKNYPWQDTINWEYVDSKTILVKKGFEPPVKDFTIENEYGEDVKDYFLFDPNYTFMLISYDLDKANTRKQEKINNFARQAMDKGMHFICLTSSPQEQIEAFKQEHHVPYDFFFCDEITLKTIIRSNPGLLFTQEGTIINKWHWKDVPKFEKVKY
ncbi:MAG TPA: DoxX family protein [Prolixibacteraceae bacterium]|nr:DoxX family protein [Prolixibacteraceae bacterium]